MRPLVSVVLANYNYASYIGESIEAILGQSCDDLELLVMDDFSADNSRDVIESMRKRDKRVLPSYATRNRGVSYARNRAMEKSTGKYIAFCDSDDVWQKDKLKIQIENLEARKEYDVTFCDSSIIDEKGTETGDIFSSKYGKARDSGGDLFRELCETNFVNNSTVLMRTSCVDKVGLQDEKLRYVQDWFYWICLARQFRFLFIDSVLAKYRVHARSTNLDTDGYSRERIMTCTMIMERFGNLPRDMKSALYYKIACEYGSLGKKKDAYEGYRMSLRYNKVNLKSYLKIPILFFGLDQLLKT